MQLLLELGAGLEWKDGAGLTALQVCGCAVLLCGRLHGGVGCCRGTGVWLHLGVHVCVHGEQLRSCF